MANTWEMNREASPGESSILEVEMNIACFVNWSTMTKMPVWPLDSGSCSMKSIEIESQGQRGMGSWFRRP